MFEGRPLRILKTCPNAITTFKGFWKNHVTRILLIVALSNLGAMLGSWIAGRLDSQKDDLKKKRDRKIKD